MAAFLLGRAVRGNSYIARLATYAEQSTNWGLFFRMTGKSTQADSDLGLRGK